MSTPAAIAPAGHCGTLCPVSALDTIFVGAEYEENLSSRTMASVARHEGFTSGILGFNADREMPIVLASILQARPALVGLSMAFQHRALEFIRLADALRNEGYDGHIVAGGNPVLATLDALIAEIPDVKMVRQMDEDVGMGLFTPKPSFARVKQ